MMAMVQVQELSERKKKKTPFQCSVLLYRFDESNKYFIQKCVIDKMTYNMN